MSDSVRPHRWQPTRLPRAWDSPGKNTGVGCHSHSTFPRTHSPVHESEKWKWSHSVVSNPQRAHGLQPSRLLGPWDFPGKLTEVECHCLLLLFTWEHAMSWYWISYEGNCWAMKQWKGYDQTNSFFHWGVLTYNFLLISDIQHNYWISVNIVKWSPQVYLISVTIYNYMFFLWWEPLRFTFLTAFKHAVQY